MAFVDLLCKGDSANTIVSARHQRQTISRQFAEIPTPEPLSGSVRYMYMMMKERLSKVLHGPPANLFTKGTSRCLKRSMQLGKNCQSSKAGRLFNPWLFNEICNLAEVFVQGGISQYHSLEYHKLSLIPRNGDDRKAGDTVSNSHSKTEL